MSESPDPLVERLAGYIDEGGAPWVRELGFEVTGARSGDVSFIMPGGPSVVHRGGVICGQAIMAGMDTGMVYVMASLLDEGEDPNFTTIQLQTTFERGAPADTDHLVFHAWATKPGRRIVFGQVDCFLPSGERCATATTQYMWLERDDQRSRLTNAAGAETATS